MAELPSADELARKILAIFKRNDGRAGNAMPKGVFLAQSRNVGLAFNDVGRALESAAGFGWSILGRMIQSASPNSASKRCNG